ncbi:MAG: SDR family oxidoreductase [Bacteroidia bacterium]|nr:SDR family oxidoreductase [Bacteroidia bacterium]NNF31398.1 SDR family oxidoreductase [Flavobacteriaceae bacterium]MBT8275935.1 SDR family oxidoreductase [Bacteroidia bacterium]NNJ81233.1 SDR family oxidoreductase [Flavobacteriaceae bacterium]NNK53010.1 SDR family oxidoreductase [Flavobacteriaceae bacterium]
MQKRQTAVILGGSSGLGLASARKLAETGFDICIVHRTRKSDLPAFTKAVAEMESFGSKITSFNKDALKSETINEVIGQLAENSVGLLLHSIAKGSLKPLTSENALNNQDIEITLHAMGYSWYEWTKALLDANKFASKVRNLAFTSEGNSKVWPGYAAVSAAKATLEAMMRSMAVEYAKFGITSNCIQAGATETPSFKMIPGSEKLAEAAKKRNPFRRLTTAEDVANAVYLMSREEAGWINGTVIKADGGESLS